VLLSNVVLSNEVINNLIRTKLEQTLWLPLNVSSAKADLSSLHRLFDTSQTSITHRLNSIEELSQTRDHPTDVIAFDHEVFTWYHLISVGIISPYGLPLALSALSQQDRTDGLRI